MCARRRSNDAAKIATAFAHTKLQVRSDHQTEQRPSVQHPVSRPFTYEALFVGYTRPPTRIDRKGKTRYQADDQAALIAVTVVKVSPDNSTSLHSRHGRSSDPASKELDENTPLYERSVTPKSHSRTLLGREKAAPYFAKRLTRNKSMMKHTDKCYSQNRWKLKWSVTPRASRIKAVDFALPSNKVKLISDDENRARYNYSRDASP
ncbi:hypothetical protein EI94DRAFT_664090 [Lactarius quietus]|nr:hypothetical protein EI94DRAFT_664090 [Lactarius quietus]